MHSLRLGHHPADEKELWALRDDDPAARDELVSRYLPFARRIAMKYRNGRESFDDLVQVASVGLLNAVNRFDPSQGSPFMAFASPTISGELKRYFRDRIWMIRVPRDLQEEIIEVDGARQELGAALHREPTLKEIDGHTGLGDGSARRATIAEADRKPASLDTALEDGQTELERFGVDDPTFEAIDESDELREAMEGIGDVESKVLRLRFVEDMTQTEIAERVGCSQMHISRVLQRSAETIVERLPED